MGHTNTVIEKPKKSAKKRLEVKKVSKRERHRSELFVLVGEKNGPLMV